MGSLDDKWREIVAPHFDFVMGHGFEPAGVHEGFRATSCSYRSSNAVIRITRSDEFGRAEVSLIRLVDDAVPPYPIWVTSQPLDHTLLDNVLEARRSPLLEDSRRMPGLDDVALERQLAFWAEALRTVAPDFLAGRLSAIDEAESVVRARVAENPQTIVAWLAEGAPSGAERASIEELEALVPPEVGVETRRIGGGRT